MKIKCLYKDGNKQKRGIMIGFLVNGSWTDAVIINEEGELLSVGFSHVKIIDEDYVCM